MYAATMALPGAAAAGSASGSTHMYLGLKDIGMIVPNGGLGGSQGWDINCAANADGLFLTRGRSGLNRKRINVHMWDGAVTAYARAQTATRWAIYRWIYNTDDRHKILGFAVRRSATRWDVIRRQRKVGYTIGPDGPPAATALLMCSR
jgi:hypothetical protein